MTPREQIDEWIPDPVIGAPPVDEQQRDAAGRSTLVEGEGGAVGSAVDLHWRRLRRGGFRLPENGRNLGQKKVAEVGELLFADARNGAHLALIDGSHRAHRP